MRRAFLFLVAAGLVAFAVPPMFRDFEYVFAGANAITVEGGHADPCVMDWDGDGLKDLLLGEFTQGRIRVYANVGTNAEPGFDAWQYLEADGGIITLPYG